jgi:hypothetical protein
LVVLAVLASSLACVPKPTADEYRKAIQEPVWNREPIDADALADEFWNSPAVAIKTYARKVVRVRGVVVAISEAPPTQSGRRWSVLLQSEKHRSPSVGVSCLAEPGPDVARLGRGSVAIVRGEPRAGVPAMNLEDCVVEHIGGDGPPAVAPAAVTVDPSFVEEVVVGAAELDRAYADDEAAATATYGGRPLLIAGTLAGLTSQPLALAGSAIRTLTCMDLWPGAMDLKGTRVTVRAKVQANGFLGVKLWACRRVAE